VDKCLQDLVIGLSTSGTQHLDEYCTNCLVTPVLSTRSISIHLNQSVSHCCVIQHFHYVVNNDGNKYKSVYDAQIHVC